MIYFLLKVVKAKVKLLTTAASGLPPCARPMVHAGFPMHILMHSMYREYSSKNPINMRFVQSITNSLNLVGQLIPPSSN